jgi:hypothetical protein
MTNTISMIMGTFIKNSSKFVGTARKFHLGSAIESSHPRSDLKGAETSDAHFMKLAIRHAQFAFREKEVPIGAVLVSREGQVIAAARNRIESSNQSQGSSVFGDRYFDSDNPPNRVSEAPPLSAQWHAQQPPRNHGTSSLNVFSWS